MPLDVPPPASSPGSTATPTRLAQSARTPAARHVWVGMTGLLLAEAIDMLDSTVVQVASLTMHAALGGRLSDVAWYSGAYTLAFAVLLISGARLGDRYGRRRMLRAGLIGFAAASLGCAAAPTAGLFITGRALAGAACALVVPQTIGLVKAMFAGPDVGRALGTIGPVMGLAAATGPAVGGLLIHADLLGLSWRTIFLINLPIVTACLYLSRWLPEDRAPLPPLLDLGGTVLVAAGTAAVVIPVVGSGSGTQSTATWALLPAGLALLATFGAHQRVRGRRGLPTLVETSLFSHPTFTVALTVSTVFFAVSTGLTLIVVLHLQVGLGAGVLTAAATLLPWPAGMAVANYLAGRWLLPRMGGRLLRLGLMVELLGLAATAAAYDIGDTHYPALLPAALAVTGVGVGLFTRTFFGVALAQVDRQQAGSAAGLINAVQQLGQTLGVAALTVVFLRVLQADTTSAPANIAAQAVLAVSAGLVLLTLGLSRPLAKAPTV